MGSSTSKAARAVSEISVSNTTRKYPTSFPPLTSNRRNSFRPSALDEHDRPIVRYESEVVEKRTQTTNQPLGADLGLQARLQSLGPVQPNSIFSSTSKLKIASRPSLQHSRDQLPPSPSSPLPSQVQSQRQTPTPNHNPSSTPLNFRPAAWNHPQTILSVQSNKHTRVQARQNPAISLLTVRYRLAEDAEYEFSQVGKVGAVGRQFLDVITLRQIFQLRDEKGIEAGEIEKQLGLREGVVTRLGKRLVVGTES